MLRTTQAQVAHFLLQKNYLAGSGPAGLADMIQALVGLPVTSLTRPFLMVAARLKNGTAGVGKTQNSELKTQNSLPFVQTVLMRSANYIIPTADFLAWHAATARQHNQDFNAEFRLWGLPNAEADSLAGAIMAVIGPEPSTVEMVSERLPAGRSYGPRLLSQTSRGGRVRETSNVALVLRWLVARGQLSVEPAHPADLWRTGPPAYAPLASGYPDIDPAAAPGEATAQADLARAYLAAYGPASEADLSFWTGLSKSETARALGALAAETTLVLVEGLPGMMLLLRSQAGALAVTGPAPAPIVNVLPADDSFVIAHRASRARLLPEPKLQGQVFTASGAARPTILVDGQVVGLWPEEPATAGRAEPSYHLLTEVDPAVLPLIEAELERMAGIMNGDW